MKEKIELLKNTPTFSGMEEEILHQVATALKEIKVKPGRKIIKKDEPGKSMFIIQKGVVKVHDGNHVLSRLGRGDVFGEYALIDEEKRSATVTAEEESTLQMLEQDDFYSVITSTPSLTKGILRVLIKRLRERNELEEKLSKSYVKIRRQKTEIEKQHQNIKDQKKLLEQQNYDLLSLNDEKNHLISIIVHGLKNPMTSSICVADLLEESKENLSEAQLEYLGLIKKSLRRMNTMVNEILDLGAIDSKKYRLKRELMRISPVIREVIQNFNTYISRKQLRVNTALKDLSAKLNEVYLFQIMDNLISNAVKYSPEKASLSIRLYEKNNKVRIEVEDNGPGVAENELDEIFNRYSRQTDKLIEPEEQSGLGLAIVKNYVDALNGKVWCESGKGEGARFIVEFEKPIEQNDGESLI